MNNTHKRLKEILKREKNTPQDIKTLYNKLFDNIHGNTNINTQSTKELINKIIEETKLNNTKVTSVDIKESTYNCHKDKGLDTPFLHIILLIEGSYNGKIYFETNSGTKTANGKPIYYIYSHKDVFTSKLEEKIINFYKNTYPVLIEELFLDIALDKRKYLSLDTQYGKYELWDCKPSMYSETMEGYYNDSNNKYMDSFYKYESLGRVCSYKNIQDFGNQDESANWTKENVEWRRYYI